MNIKQISLIEPKSKNRNLWSLVKQPRLGLIILATILKSKGYNVKVFCENISPIDWDYVYNSDICGISSLTLTANESYEIAEKIGRKKIPVVFGGPHATLLAEETLKHCDIVVRGEGEYTFLELIEALKNKTSLKKVKGILFKEGEKIINTPPTHFLEDLDKLPSPDMSLVHGWAKLKDLPGVLVTSRGCPYDCEFCSVTKLVGRKWRTRSTKNVIRDFKAIIKVRKPSKIFIVDDNFIVDKKRTKGLLDQIIKNNFGIVLYAQIRIDSATDEEIVKLMKKAGFRWVYIGFESISQITLNEYNKKVKLEDMILGIKTLKKNGIAIHGMFVPGSDADEPNVVEDTLNFCLEHGIDTIQFFPLTALPGTRLTEKLKAENRLIDVPWNCYDAQHVNIFPKHIRPSVLQREIVKAYKKFYSLRRAIKLFFKTGYSTNLPVHYIFFGNFLLKQELRYFSEYIKSLEKVEHERYKGNTLVIQNCL
jgi:radical SAM superfamily enzyme YgiQ (UPF0313 family)